MAAASLLRSCWPWFISSSQVRRHGFLTSSSRSCNPFSSSSLKSLNGDGSRSPEEQAKMGLKQLDDQLSAPASSSSPRSPFPGTNIEDLQKEANSKGRLPDFSDGFILFLGGGLLLLTVVNNLLFYFFVEHANRDSQVQQQTVEKKLESRNLSVDDNKAAPNPQMSSNM